MPSVSRVLPDYPIVETVYSGVLLPDELKFSVRETIRLSQESQISNLIADCTHLEGGHSVFDLYLLAENIAPLIGNRKLREAVIRPQREEIDCKSAYWKNLKSIHGIEVRIFEDRQAAIHWLCGET